MDLTEAFRVAYDQARTSRDPSTQNGAVVFTYDDIEIGRGWNRPPSGLDIQPAVLKDRTARLDLMAHAEHNAILSALHKDSYRIEGGTIVCPWAACVPCARLIIEVGIIRVIRHAERMAHPGDWADEIARADQLLTRAGIGICDYSAHFGLLSIRVQGGAFAP